MDERCCIICNESIDHKRIDAVYCSERCRRKIVSKRYYDNHPHLMRLRRLKENSKVEKRIWSRVKSRAKSKNIPFDLEIEDIIVPELCPVLGIKIFSMPGAGTNQHNSPSVDRIIPELGYVKSNIRIISMRANLLKSNATIQELKLILKDLEEIENILLRH